MRIKFLSLALLAGAGLAATPAMAESAAGADQPYRGYQQPYRGYQQPYRGYNQPYRGYDQRGYGYNGAQQHFAYNKVRELQGRVRQMQQDIDYFGRQRAISANEHRKLFQRAAKLQQRIARMSYNGLNRGEYQRVVEGIRNLRREIQRDLNDGRRYSNYGYGYAGQQDRYYRDDNRYWNDRRWDDRRYDDRRRYDRRDRDDWDD